MVPAGVASPVSLWLIIPLLIVAATIVEFVLAVGLGKAMAHASHEPRIVPSSRPPSVPQDSPPD